MNDYRADLHIHSALSPCGDLDMSPVAIVREACRKGLDIIGISDHNTTRHAPLMTELGAENGLFVLPGVEINTREEAHCLAFFENLAILASFQEFLDTHLPRVPNDPVRFGYQVQLDRFDRIVYEENRFLFNAIDQPVEAVERRVHALGGIFIPSHIDRPRNSIISQLGFIAETLNVDAVEISRKSNVSDYLLQHPGIGRYTIVTSSDAHYLSDIGAAYTVFRMRERSFVEIRKALRGLNGREVIVP